MTKIRNEVASATRTTWISNFNAESNNIYDDFNTNEIVLTKTIYEKLMLDYSCHIRIYFGLNASGGTVAIALPAYKLDELDSESMDRQWDNIYRDGYIYDLYKESTMTIAEAQSYITNWNANSSDELFLKGFIIPRSNLIDIFENQDQDYCLIDFGLKKEIKLMTQACTSGGTPLANPVVGDKAVPCPPVCSYIEFLDL
ncbi:MAG: hypothetical protein C0596_09580 [Marinilabiliales bacterium]|nr:MAG: hypothetical protein C0596_09580 [Marinilabiliales bacterium]